MAAIWIVGESKAWYNDAISFETNSTRGAPAGNVAMHVPSVGVAAASL